MPDDDAGFSTTFPVNNRVARVAERDFIAKMHLRADEAIKIQAESTHESAIMQFIATMTNFGFVTEVVRNTRFREE